MATKSNSKSGYFDVQSTRMTKAKEKIAKHVIANYLAPGDSIVIDAGTTLWPIAEELAKAKETSYSVMTHNYIAFEKLQVRAKEGGLNLFLAGGRYDDDLKAFFGDQTCRAYESFGPRKVFLGVSGLSAGSGLRCRGNTEESQVKELISKLPAQHRIIVADFTKFGNTDALQFANTADLTIATMEQAEGHTPFKVCATIVTNKPNEGDYNEFRNWFITRGTSEKLIPTLEEIKATFDLEVQNFKAFGIEVDIIE
jgi:DeoR/GlpR family transcriptional regulator of sugar metabolism